MKNLKEMLMERDKISEDEANKRIEAAMQLYYRILGEHNDPYIKKDYILELL